MPFFKYEAADRAGNIGNGVIEASNREIALRQLRSKGFIPVRIEVTGERGTVGAGGSRPKTGKLSVLVTSKVVSGNRRKPDHADIHSFTSELAIMLRAGLPLDRALKVLIGMALKPTFAALIEEIFREVKGGRSFSHALTPHQHLFGDFYINMVRSGEAGGQLADVLSRLAEHLERLKVLRESVISALIYPAILIVVAVISVFLMLGFVVPQFQTLFDEMGEALPMPTRVIVSAGDFVTGYGWLMLIVGAAVIWAIRRWLETKRGRQWRDIRLLRLPVLGSVVLKYETTRFARTMGTLLGNGVSIVKALEISSATMGNCVLREALTSVVPSIKQGGRMAEALGRSRLFTPLALNMVRLGEETGKLDEMLLEVARLHDNEVQSGVKRALTLIEPALILVLGGVIAAIIMSILMGILSVNELVM